MGESNEGVCDGKHQTPSSDYYFGCVTCTTFNILAPIYKRLSDKNRESEFRELWVNRNKSILDRLIYLKSSIICLQEFWVGNEELVRMYETSFEQAGYAVYTLARTNKRGDGLLTAVKHNQFHVLNHKEFVFNDIGNRVAQLLHVELLVHFQNQFPVMEKEALILNTHLIFPHDFSYCFLRLKQVYKILQSIESYCHEYRVPPVPIILCGDWNGSKKGNVYKFLRSQGFVSSYDTVHHYIDNGEDSLKWISHLNHRGNMCGVDFIWLLNPTKRRKPLKESFTEAVLGNINNMLLKVSRKELNPLNFLGKYGNFISYSQFFQALTELALTGYCKESLSSEDIMDLWECMDRNEDGVIDIAHFTRSMKPFASLKETKGDCDENTQRTKETANSEPIFGFDVKKATLFPSEVERGIWPDNYHLSDHAALTVELYPVKLQCS